MSHYMPFDTAYEAIDIVDDLDCPPTSDIHVAYTPLSRNILGYSNAIHGYWWSLSCPHHSYPSSANHRPSI